MVKKTGWFIFLLIMSMACLDEPDCYSLNNYVIGIAFKKLPDSESDTVLIGRITAEGTDSVFRATMGPLSTIGRLPLNYYQNETVFYLEGADTLYKLHLKYSAKPQLVSESCGERFVLEGLHVFEHNFDSIRVVNAVPNRRDKTSTHLEIYRKP